LAVANATSRDAAGFLMSEQRAISTDTYAIASTNLRLADGPAAGLPQRWVGTAKVQVTTQGANPVFLGVAATRDATAYLQGVAHATIVDIPPRPAPPLRCTARRQDRRRRLRRLMLRSGWRKVLAPAPIR
jgi:hypothetical protein